MKKIKLLLLFCLIYPTLAFAGDRQIIDIQTKYNIKYFINDYTYVINKKSQIDNSFSILQNGCSIELNNNGKPILMKTKTKDFEFTFLHEIAHCVLGKKVFYEPIDWKINISQEEKSKIEDLITENESFYLKNKRTPLLKVIYHEIFADTFATILYIKNNKSAAEDIKVLLNNRIKQNKNPYDSHLSVNAIKYLLNEQEQIKNLTIDNLKDKAIQITQEKLLQYIRAEYE